MKVIIAGSRDINNYHFLLQAISLFKYKISEVVSGTARGVDRLGERWAIAHKIPIKKFPADWDKYDNKAGHFRNREMAEYADALIALWNGRSKGTQNMINIAKQYNLKILIQKVEN